MNKISTQQKIDEICQQLEDIFKPINTTLCPVCPHPFPPPPARRMSDSVTGIRGCCTNCAICGWGGYHYNEKFSTLRHEFKFDKNTGFFDDNKKCCSLPRAKRSLTCLEFVCNEGRKMLGEYKIDLVHILVSNLDHLRSKLEKEK
jgi:hypothetical protein